MSKETIIFAVGDKVEVRAPHIDGGKTGDVIRTGTLPGGIHASMVQLPGFRRTYQNSILRKAQVK